MEEVVEEIYVGCKGRTGPKRPDIYAKLEYMKDGSLRIRVDDIQNPEFWLELKAPPPLQK